MKRIRLVVRVLVVTLAIAAGAIGTGAWWWGRQSLPSLDGEQRFAGLTAPVEILTDGYGVPHVYAAGPEDAWFSAGVLHARDRLWQMELYRRAANGRLSEVLGAQTLPLDRRLLTLGLAVAAETEWGTASPAVRAALTRYAEGVNSQIERAVGRARPLEFQILRFNPAPWRPVDSLAVGRLLSWRLAENHQAELVRAALGARFGPGEADRLAGAYPADAPTVLGTKAPPVGQPPLTSASPATFDSLARAFEEAARAGSTPRTAPLPRGLQWLDPGARRGNSNNFVVAGSRTTSGRPIVANDPHLQMEFPGVWYEMHLVAASLDVVGVTVPGTPFVILGHNSRIAWGMTNTGADVQDLYVERLDLARRRYFYQGQWLPIDVSRFEIPVRGAPTEAFEVWRTRHGTIYAEVGLDWETAPAWLTPGPDRTGERRAFALRWEIGGETAGAFEALDRARDWNEFVAAVERFSAPSQNFVYGDVDGNIGYAMSGVLPVRPGTNGSAPLDGASGEGEWVGRVNPAQLPRAFNPPSGYITSSNNEIDRHWPGLITRDWTAPFRTTRLHQLLGKTERLGVSNATVLQNDILSLASERLLARAASAVTAGQRAGGHEIAANALSRMQSWDRRVNAQPVVALYQTFEDALWRRTFLDEMGEPLFNRFYEWAGAERFAGLYAIIDDNGDRWFDDIATIDRRETRDEVFLLAARDAVERLEREVGGQDDWNWPEMHAATFAHSLGGAAFPLAWLFNRGPAPLAGDGTTVMRVSFNRLRPYRAWELPSWRQVLDVGNWDESRVVLPAGQSGHPLSPHYFDQNDLWRQGEYRPQHFSRGAVERSRAHRLLLTP